MYCRYFHWEICSWMWTSLAIIYLSNCPLNARYYEFTVGMSLVSITVSSMSNILSDYRINLPPGKQIKLIPKWVYEISNFLGRLRTVFNMSAILHCSWILRILYPLVWNIHQQPTEVKYSEILA